jgi:hypothetical protein
MTSPDAVEQIEYRWENQRDLVPVASSMPPSPLQGWNALIHTWVRHPDNDVTTESVRYQQFPDGRAVLVWRYRDARAAKRADGSGRPLVSRAFVAQPGLLTPDVAIVLSRAGLPERAGQRPVEVPVGSKLPPVSAKELRGLAGAQAEAMDSKAAREPGLAPLLAVALAQPDVPLAILLAPPYMCGPLKDALQPTLLWGLWRIGKRLLGDDGRGWSFSTFEAPLGDSDPSKLPGIVFRVDETMKHAPARPRTERRVRPRDPSASAALAHYPELPVLLVEQYKARGGEELDALIQEWSQGASFGYRLAAVHAELKGSRRAQSSEGPVQAEPDNSAAPAHGVTQAMDAYRNEPSRNDVYRDDANRNDAYRDEAGSNDAYRNEDNHGDAYRSEAGSGAQAALVEDELAESEDLEQDQDGRYGPDESAAPNRHLLREWQPESYGTPEPRPQPEPELPPEPGLTPEPERALAPDRASELAEDGLELPSWVSSASTGTQPPAEYQTAEYQPPEYQAPEYQIANYQTPGHEPIDAPPATSYAPTDYPAPGYSQADTPTGRHPVVNLEEDGAAAAPPFNRAAAGRPLRPYETPLPPQGQRQSLPATEQPQPPAPPQRPQQQFPSSMSAPPTSGGAGETVMLPVNSPAPAPPPAWPAERPGDANSARAQQSQSRPATRRPLRGPVDHLLAQLVATSNGPDFDWILKSVLYPVDLPQRAERHQASRIMQERHWYIPELIKYRYHHCDETLAGIFRVVLLPDLGKVQVDRQVVQWVKEASGGTEFTFLIRALLLTPQNEDQGQRMRRLVEMALAIRVMTGIDSMDLWQVDEPPESPEGGPADPSGSDDSNSPWWKKRPFGNRG